MRTRTFLQALFTTLFCTLLAYTLWASLQQPVWHWRGPFSGEDRWWTIASLIDAYYGFITFFVWLCLKERGALRRVTWFIAVMLLGNLAMAGYVLWQLKRLPRDAPLHHVLLPDEARR